MSFSISMNRRNLLKATASGLAGAAITLPAVTLPRIASAADAEALVRIPSPDRSLFNDILLPGHQGLIREGIQDQAQLATYPTSRVDQPIHLQLLYTNARDSMLRLRVVADDVDADLLKATFDIRNGSDQLNAGKYADQDQYQINQKAMKAANQLAVALLSDEAVGEYMLNDKSRSRPGDQSWGARTRTNSLSFGGLAATEFERRRAFNAFVDNLLPVLMAWSKQPVFDTEFYVASQLRLPPYQFDLGGYVFNLTQFQNGTGAAHDDTRTFFNNLQQTYPLPGGQRARGRTGRLISIGETEAEAITSRYQNSQLYGLYRASATALMPYIYTPIEFRQTITSDAFEVYADAALTERIFTIEI